MTENDALLDFLNAIPNSPSEIDFEAVRAKLADLEASDSQIRSLVYAIINNPQAYDGLRERLAKLNKEDQEKLFRILDSRNVPALGTGPVQ